MSVALYKSDELANMADYLTRGAMVEGGRAALRTVCMDLATYSQANTRAFNEQYNKTLTPISAPEILGAYDADTYRYDRARALKSLRQLNYNVETDDRGRPVNFESFDLERYLIVMARIMTQAYTRLLNETGTD